MNVWDHIPATLWLGVWMFQDLTSADVYQATLEMGKTRVKVWLSSVQLLYFKIIVFPLPKDSIKMDGI